MRLQHQWWGVVLAAGLAGLVGVTAVAAGGEQFIPVLGVREGALKALGIPMTNGFIDYLTLLNERDGGINGVTLIWEECETVYDVDRGVECYERLKTKGPTGAAAVAAFWTPLAYALTERATHDQIPLLSIGIGRADAADGRVFPYVFNPPSSYWSQNTAKIRFIGQRVGGMDQLKGLKIAHVYHDSAYGRETLPILNAQAARYGFAVQHLPVPPPGLDQKATWLRVKVAQPDWVILRSRRRHDPDRPEGSGPGRLPPREDRGAASGLCGAGDNAGRGGGHRPHLRDLVGHGDPLPAYPGDAPVRLCPGQGSGAGRGCRHDALDPGHAARPAHGGGAPHGHAPLRPPAPDGGAGAVGT